METHQTFLSDLKTCEDHQSIKVLLDSFAQISPANRTAMEPELITLLTDHSTNQVARSWIPAFLGLVGTPTARQCLLDQLHSETDGYVRGYIAQNLIEYFQGDDLLEAVIGTVRKEKISAIKVYITQELIKSGSSLMIPLLLEMTKGGELSERNVAVWGLGRLKAREAVPNLCHLLEQSDIDYVIHNVIKSLQEIGDRQAISPLLKVAENVELAFEVRVSALVAISNLAVGGDENIAKLLVPLANDKNRVLAITTTDALLKILPVDAVARLIANFALDQEDEATLTRLSDALRVVGSTNIVGYLGSIRGNKKQEANAQILLEQIGGRQALNELFQRRLATLDTTQERVQAFDDQGLDIFMKTILDARRGFQISLGMSLGIFLIGIGLLITCIILMVKSNQLIEYIIAAGTGLAGLGTVLTMFYKGPLERVEQAVLHLVNIEIVFLGYIRQVTQISAMFEREYLSGQDFSLTQLNEMLKYTDQSMRKAIPLIKENGMSSTPVTENPGSTQVKTR